MTKERFVEELKQQLIAEGGGLPLQMSNDQEHSSKLVAHCPVMEDT